MNSFPECAILTAGCLLLAVCAVWAAPPAESENMAYSTSFGRGQWNPEDWILVKSPRWDYVGSWVQGETCIENLTPEDAEPDRVIPRPHAYMSMVLKEPFSTEDALEITARMEFGFDQGPQIVLAGELGANEAGYPEYRDHFEVVLFARGINIWHHVYRDGEPGWTNVAYARFPLERETPYDLTVRITTPRTSANVPAEGKMIEVSVDGEHLFAYHEPALPEKIHVGIIGYASINRFYRFEAGKR